MNPIKAYDHTTKQSSYMLRSVSTKMVDSDINNSPTETNWDKFNFKSKDPSIYCSEREDETKVNLLVILGNLQRFTNSLIFANLNVFS